MKIGREDQKIVISPTDNIYLYEKDSNSHTHYLK